MSEIESAMGWNRVETVNAMGVLMDKGMIKLTEDRLYVVQKQDESS
ncbi:MAG: hypothetical protein GDA48_17020 [Hormoscilla sp. GM102CHS1]|nr:hypothetical protein [Hormoscilla sp. GM102CHS1]